MSMEVILGGSKKEMNGNLPTQVQFRPVTYELWCNKKNLYIPDMKYCICEKKKVKPNIQMK